MERRQFQYASSGPLVNGLIRCYERLKQLDQAETWRRKWMAVVKERSGAESPGYAAELSALGANLLEGLGDYHFPVTSTHP